MGYITYILYNLFLVSYHLFIFFAVTYYSLLVKQPSHNIRIIIKQSASAMLIPHASLCKIVMLLNIKDQKLIYFLLRQALLFIKRVISFLMSCFLLNILNFFNNFFTILILIIKYIPYN